MLIEIKRCNDGSIHSVIATKEPNDPKIYGKYLGAGESRLLHLIKKKLNTMGFNLIKKRMWKDGHMVDDLQQYLRVRKPKRELDQNFCLWNTSWAIKSINEDWNKDGQCVLHAHDILPITEKQHLLVH